MGAAVGLGVGGPGLQMGSGLRRGVRRSLEYDGVGAGEREEVRPGVEFCAKDVQEVGAHGGVVGDFDGKVTAFSAL